jgi:DNA-binding response OmpR family regulator
VLFVSGYANDGTVLEGGGSAGAYLQKPFTPQELSLKVREVLTSA